MLLIANIFLNYLSLFCVSEKIARIAYETVSAEYIHQRTKTESRARAEDSVIGKSITENMNKNGKMSLSHMRFFPSVQRNEYKLFIVVKRLHHQRNDFYTFSPSSLEQKRFDGKKKK